MRRMFGFLIGIVVGALVGSTVALLLAPESGEQLRGELRERGNALLADVRSAADSRRIELQSRLEELRAPADSGECVALYETGQIYLSGATHHRLIKFFSPRHVPRIFGAAGDECFILTCGLCAQVFVFNGFNDGIG